MKTVNLLSEQAVYYYGLPFKNQMELNRFKMDHIPLLEKENPNLIHLGRHTSGIHISFETDSNTLSFQCDLVMPSVMKHMTMLAESGIDVYLYHQEQFRFFASFGPSTGQKSYTYQLDFKQTGTKHVVLYFPLYNGINRLQVSYDGQFLKRKKMTYKSKFLIYGTSITQGACASRPGLSLTSMLSRMLNIEFINYGFSGQGLGETSMVDMMIQIPNLDGIIIDYEANSGAVDKLIPTLNPILDLFRKKYPNIPIILLGRIPSEVEYEHQEVKKKRIKHHQFYLETIEKRKDQNLFYIKGEDYFPGSPLDLTVDGIHLNDRGFHHLSTHLFPYLLPLTK